MPDENKTTNANQPITGKTPAPVSPPTTTPFDVSGQAVDSPPPPPMENGASSPPPPIVEKTKPEKTPVVEQVPKTNEQAQEIPNIPPVITTSGTGGKKPVNKKMIATILGILVLVGGLGAGVILVQNNQDIREKAWIPENVDVPYCSEDMDDKCIHGCTETVSGGKCKSAPDKTDKTTADKTTDTTADKTDKTTADKTTSALESACEAADYTCIVDSADCPQGSGKPQSCTTTSTGAAVNRTDNKGYCCNTTAAWTPNPNCIPDGKCLAPGEDCCSSPSYGSFDNTCHTTESRCGSGSGPDPDPDPDPKPTLPPGITCSCLPIKAFDDEWVAITNLSSLVAGDVVRFTVEGKTNSGAIDMARFTINGTLGPEITTRKPSTNEFYYEYTIPADTTSFTINAEIHHTTIGWF